MSAKFSWFHRRDKGREDHVISLCEGHAYLTEKGGWKPGPGDMPDLPPATGCPVCKGFPPTPRMKNAPLRAVKEIPVDSATQAKMDSIAATWKGPDGC